MPDRGTEKRAKWALGDLVAGKYQDVARFLATVSGQPEPELTVEDVAALRERITHLQTTLVSVRIEEQRRAQREEAERRARPIRPQPKPHRRHKEPDKLAEFRALYPHCAVLYCQGTDADPHHIWERGEGGGAGGGSDDHANLLNLCRHHHDEWHDPRVGRDGFLAKYGPRRLPNVAILKIKLAAEMIAESKLCGREVVDLDAEGM